VLCNKCNGVVPSVCETEFGIPKKTPSPWKLFFPGLSTEGGKKENTAPLGKKEVALSTLSIFF
jgi:hypothetical protein